MLIQRTRGRREQIIEGVRFIQGVLMGRRVLLALSGAGKVNAAMTATLLIEHFRPSEVIFTGVAGAINPDLKHGDIVIAGKTVQHDYGGLTDRGIECAGTPNPFTGRQNLLFFPGDARRLKMSLGTSESFEPIKTETGERAPSVVTGIIATGDVFVASPSKKRELRKQLGADSVEMEGAAVAQICWERKVPCLVIRSVSDLADTNAARDFRTFYKAAARNPAALVGEIIHRLSPDEP